MASFSLSGYGLPKLTEAEFLSDFLGDEYDSAKVNRVITMQDLIDNKDELHDDNKSYADLVYDFLLSFVPDYTEAHPVNKNLGILLKSQQKFSFYGAEVYYQDDVLALHIGAKTKEVEPLILPLTWHEDRSQWGISNSIPSEGKAPLSIFSALTIDVIKLLGDKKLHVPYLTMTNPRATRGEKTNIARVKLVGEKTSFKEEAEALQVYFYEENSDFSELVSGRSSGSYSIAKPNKFLKQYYAAKKFETFVFPVTSIKFEEVGTVEKFTQFKLEVDFSDYPDVPVQVIDFTGTNKEGILAPLNSVRAMQFPTSKALMDKYEKALADQENPVKNANSLSLPTPSNPWYIEFAGLPRQANFTPPINIWAKESKPERIFKKLAACKSPAYYSGVTIEELVPEETEEYIAPAVSTDVDDSDDDFGSIGQLTPDKGKIPF